jgi:hypothetical protein
MKQDPNNSNCYLFRGTIDEDCRRRIGVALGDPEWWIRFYHQGGDEVITSYVPLSLLPVKSTEPKTRDNMLAALDQQHQQQQSPTTLGCTVVLC